MKRRAQRMFADGVDVPPSASTSERRQDVANINKEENPTENVTIQLNQTASQFLDMISLRNVHQHTRPVVLINKLAEQESATAKSQLNVPKKVLKPSTTSKDRIVKPQMRVNLPVVDTSVKNEDFVGKKK